MSEFTVFAVNFYRFDCVKVRVIIADAAPLTTILGVILERERLSNPSTVDLDICVDFMSPADRLHNLCTSTELIIQMEDRPAIIAELQDKLRSALVAIIVDAPVSDSYFVVETKRELLCSDPPLTGI